MSDDGSRVLGEVHWVAGYGHADEGERRAEAIARAHRFDASERMLTALQTARDLISEAIDSHIYQDGDEIPDDCGYHAGLREIDAAIAAAEGRPAASTPTPAESTKFWPIKFLAGADDEGDEQPE
jgi:hypothetical protein